MPRRQWMQELRQDTVIAARQLGHGPGFALVATLTLALGVGATTAVFAVVDAVMLRPLPFRAPAELVLVRRAHPGGNASVEATYPEYRHLRDGARSFSGLAAVPSAMQPAVWTDGTSNEPLGAVGTSGTCSTFWVHERSSVAPSAPSSWIEVVGVVGAARYRDPRVESLDAYVPYTQSPWNLNHLVVRTVGDPTTLASSVRSALAELDPEVKTVRVATVAELASAALRQPRFQVTLVGTFASLALVLGAVGIFGIVSFATARRTRELGVRVALGARATDLHVLVLGEHCVRLRRVSWLVSWRRSQRRAFLARSYTE